MLQAQVGRLEEDDVDGHDYRAGGALGVAVLLRRTRRSSFASSFEGDRRGRVRFESWLGQSGLQAQRSSSQGQNR